MDLQSFNFNHSPISVLTSENGEPLFIAKEVCDVLNHTNSRKAISDLCDPDDVTTGYIPHPQSSTKQLVVNLINESALYQLIFGSRLESAKAFKKWVTSEVLPAIRKHGMYATTPTLEQMIANPDTIIQLATALKEERQQKELLTEQNRLLRQTTINSAPKIKFYNEVLQSESAFTTTQLAKELGLSSGQKLNQILKEKGIEYRQSGQWLLHAKYSSMELTKTRTHAHTGETGEQRTSHLTVWTEKGRKFIHEIIKQQSKTG